MACAHFDSWEVKEEEVLQVVPRWGYYWTGDFGGAGAA
jgi:hypothetical protein